jgi:hypothetical protein
MIDYQQFVDELKRLDTEAAELRNTRRMDQDPKFRSWRPELESLIHQIARAGYLLPNPINVRGRAFGGSNLGHEAEDALFAEYQRDIDDTRIELGLVIGNFQKFGVPAIQNAVSTNVTNPGPSASAGALQVTEKVSLAWLWEHVPFKFWWSAAGILIATFWAGVYIGKWLAKAGLLT